MHAVIRTYSGKGAKELFDVLEKKKADVESLLRPIKGFVSYTLARSGDGGFSVTVCQDKTGTDESVKAARDWIAKKHRKHRRRRTESSRGFGYHPPEIAGNRTSCDYRPLTERPGHYLTVSRTEGNDS